MCSYNVYTIILGTSSALQHHPKLKVLDQCGEEEGSKTACNKDTGEREKMQKWTRGVWVCASGGGHIQMWQPLYQYV